MIQHFLLEKTPISVVKFRAFVVGRRTGSDKWLKLSSGHVEQCYGPPVNCIPSDTQQHSDLYTPDIFEWTENLMTAGTELGQFLSTED